VVVAVTGPGADIDGNPSKFWAINKVLSGVNAVDSCGCSAAMSYYTAGENATIFARAVCMTLTAG
jgi:hypothetical protein